MLTKQLFWLTISAFAIGTEAFMLTGTLPIIANDLGVSLATGAYLVTIYSVIYAIGAPVLAAVTGGLDKKSVLIWGILLFALANILAAVADSYAVLFASRAAAAVAAALFMPAAFAYAGTVVAESQRGKALAIVSGGLSLAIAVGAPISTWLAQQASWHGVFGIVGAISCVAAAGIAFSLPRPPKLPPSSLRARLAPAADPSVLLALAVAVFWTIGGFSTFVFLAPLLERVALINGNMLSIALFISGASGVFGTIVGGRAVDAYGANRVLVWGLVIFGLTLTSFSVLAMMGHPENLLVPTLIAVGMAGAFSWGLNSAQQVRLMKLAPSAPNLVISLNSSAIYLGIALGSSLGAATLQFASIAELGWVAGIAEVMALIMLALSIGRQRVLFPAKIKAVS